MHKALFLIFFFPLNLSACYRVRYAELTEPKIIPSFIVHLSRLYPHARYDQVSFFQRIEHILYCKEPASLQCQAIRSLIKKAPTIEQNLCALPSEVKEKISLQEELINDFDEDIFECLRQGSAGVYRESESSCIFDILYSFARKAKTSFYFLETIRLAGGLKKEWFDQGFSAYGYVHNTVGQELLAESVKNANYNFVRWLLEFGINPNYSNAHGTMIEYAIRMDRPDIIELLVAHGASILGLNHSHHHESPLWSACEGGKVKCASLLVGLGANVNEVDNNNYSILMATVRSGNKKCVKILIKNGAEIDLKDKTGKTALFHAVGNSYNVSSIPILLKYKAEVNLPDLNMQTPLIHASQNGNVKGIKLLVEAGANVNAKDSSGKSAFFHAVDGTAEHEVYNTVKFLHEHHADLDNLDNAGSHIVEHALKRYKEGRGYNQSVEESEKVIKYLMSQSPKIGFSTRMAVFYHLNRKKVWCSALGLTAIAGGAYLYYKKN